MFENFEISEIIIIAEVLMILGVITLQVYFFRKTSQQIITLKNTFSHRLEIANALVDRDGASEKGSEYGLNSVTQLESSSVNPIHVRIKNSINNYLHHNHGATVSYSIIKDIIEREIDTKNEEISQNIPVPLYLGLGATIIGIVFGLIAMTLLNIEDTNATNDLWNIIKPLINGVTIAMVATFSGLVCTIALSAIIYTRGIAKVSEQKNQQLNYLQENLLPELHKEEDAGVLGLKNSIDNFSRTASKIVSGMQTVIENSKENILSQKQTLDRLEKLNVTKISRVNLELFDRLDSNMDAFVKFSEFLDSMQVISENMKTFAVKIDSIDDLASEIHKSVQDSKQLTQFLTSHLRKVEEMGDEALYSVDLAEKNFNSAVEKLSVTMGSIIDGLGANADQIDRKLNESYELLFKKLDEATQKYIRELAEVYRDAIPRFESFDQLQHLEQINNHLERATNGTVSIIPEINEKLKQLEESNHRLLHMSSLLDAVEKNTKNLESLKNLRVAKSSAKPHSRKTLKEWIQASFRK